MFFVLQELKFFMYLYKYKSSKDSVNSEREC